MERVYEIFPIFRERRRARAGEPSAGQQQMLGDARALLLKPRLVLPDEPTPGLAPLVFRDTLQAIET